MELTPDDTILFTLGGIAINATILFTWIDMAILTLTSMLITRNLRPDVPPNRWRTTLETIVLTIQGRSTKLARARIAACSISRARCFYSSSHPIC